MKDHDDIWSLIRRDCPLPDAPAWFASRTLARLRAERPLAHGWVQIRRWIWLGCGVVAIFSLVTTWQIHLKNLHDEQVSFAALDLLSAGEKPQYQEEAWFGSY